MLDVEDRMLEGEHSAPTSCMLDRRTIDKLTPREDWRARPGCTREVRQVMSSMTVSAPFSCYLHYDRVT
jgi:hypothetical protein